MSLLDKFLQAKRVRLIFLGDGGVGKSYLVEAMTKKFLSENYVPTIIEKYSFQGQIGELSFTTEVFMLSGQEDYSPLRIGEYEQLKNDDTPTVAMLCYNCGSRDSFENLERFWIPEVKDNCPDIHLYLVGLKSDTYKTANPEKRVTQEMASKLRKKKNMLGETRCSSALYIANGIDESKGRVEFVFTDVLRSLLKHLRGRKESTLFRRADKHPILKQPIMFNSDIIRNSFKELTVNLETKNFNGLLSPIASLEGHFGDTNIHFLPKDSNGLTDRSILGQPPKTILTTRDGETILGYCYVSSKFRWEVSRNKGIYNDIIKLSEEQQHENIVNFSSSNFFHITEGIVFILSEQYVSLSDCLKDSKPWKEPNIACVAQQLTNGLNFIHSFNIIHTNLSVNCIGINRSGLLKIFGFHARSILKLTSETDISQLAIVLFTLSTGVEMPLDKLNISPTFQEDQGYSDEFREFFDSCSSSTDRATATDLISHSFLKKAAKKMELGFFAFGLDQKEQEQMRSQYELSIETSYENVVECLREQEYDIETGYRAATVGVLRDLLSVSLDDMKNILEKGLEAEKLHIEDGMPAVISDTLVVNLAEMRFIPDYLGL